MTLLLVAFGAFFVTEFVKTILAAADQVLHPWLKMVLAYAVACLVAGLLNGWSDVENLAWALAGAGLAGLAHKVHRMASAFGDSQQFAVMAKAAGRRF